jgi:hypothetical protein
MEEGKMEQKPPGRTSLNLAVIGAILMVLGSLLIAGVHLQTTGNMRQVLVNTHGEIRTDGQAQALYEIMTRGTMLSIGGLGVVVLGFLLGILGLIGFFANRRRARQAINAP